MAYATGSGATITDLMQALRDFALAQGWTIDKWDSGNRLLFLTKGLATITMQGVTTQTVTVYTGANGAGTSVSQADHRIYFAMGTSNNAALSTYFGHPGSPVTSLTNTDAPYVNGLNGPFVAWHFFADSSVSDHIHCVVQTSAEVYKHFSFGLVDKRGMTHSGVAYVTATASCHFRNVTTYIGASGTNGAYNSSVHSPHPFLRTPSWGPFASVASYQDSPSLILKNSDAWPAAWTNPIAARSAVANQAGLSLRLRSQGSPTPSTWPSAQLGALLDCVAQSEVLPFSNVLPLHPIPLLRLHYNSTIGDSSWRICYVGDFPNVRACNMTNMSPGQEVAVGSNTFKVFPCLRQELWSNNSAVDAPSSGQFAIAYKKVA